MKGRGKGSVIKKNKAHAKACYKRIMKESFEKLGPHKENECILIL